MLKCRLACVKVQIGMCASVRSDALQSSFLAAHVVGDSRRTGFMIISCANKDMLFNKQNTPRRSLSVPWPGLAGMLHGIAGLAAGGEILV